MEEKADGLEKLRAKTIGIAHIARSDGVDGDTYVRGRIFSLSNATAEGCGPTSRGMLSRMAVHHNNNSQ